MKGGYKIIDFKNVSLSGTPVTMTDVLVDLLNNYDKVVLLSHVVLSGSAKDDCFSTVLSDGAGGVKLNCYDGYISINSSGAVTYTVASASGMASDIADLTTEIGKLEDLKTTEKESVVGAINEVKDTLDNLTEMSTFVPEILVGTLDSGSSSFTKIGMFAQITVRLTGVTANRWTALLRVPVKPINNVTFLGYTNDQLMLTAQGELQNVNTATDKEISFTLLYLTTD